MAGGTEKNHAFEPRFEPGRPSECEATKPRQSELAAHQDPRDGAPKLRSLALNIVWSGGEREHSLAQARGIDSVRGRANRAWNLEPEPGPS